MRYFSLLVILWISATNLLAQVKVSGSVISSEEKTALAFANIIVYDSQERDMITYTTSDKEGKYQLEVKKGSYILKVSYLGYKKLSLRRNFSENTTLNFTLKPQNTELKEVVIEAKSVDIIIKNDTLRYNLKALTSGKEEDLKEVLKKLPGVEIDDNGKIKANGKPIDKLLIDGKEFFGNQHQLATENISSEMIKGISLLNNYKDFNDIDPDKRTNKTAMNIEIKDEYKGLVKGNIYALGGYSKKYELKANLFTFNTKVNAFLILGGNNIGESTFSFEDYINFRGGFDALITGRHSKKGRLSSNSIPSFVFSGRNLKSKNEQLGALNCSYQNGNKFKVNSYFIFDRMNTVEERLIKQTYIEKYKGTIRNLNHTSDNRIWLNNSFFDIHFKPGKYSSVKYSANFSPQKNDRLKTDTLKTQYFNTEKDELNYGFSQNLKYNQKIEKFFFNANLYHQIKRQDDNLNILSDSVFLGLHFDNQIYSANQNLNQKINSFGLNTSLSRKIIKNISAVLSYNISKNQEHFKTLIYNTQLNNDIRLNTWEHNIGLGLNNGSKSFIIYDIGVDYNVLKINNKKVKAILPYADVQLIFSSSHNLKFYYNKSLGVPDAKDIIYAPYISDFRTFINNSNVLNNSTSTKHEIGTSYQIYDQFSGTSFNASGSYSIGKNDITNKSVSQRNYLTNYHTLQDHYSAWRVFAYFSKKFDIPLIIRLSSHYSNSEKSRFIEDKSFNFNYQSLSNSIRVRSNFDTIFNFSLGYRITYSKTKGTRIPTEMFKHKPFLKLMFDYKQWHLSINTAYEDYQSNLLERHFVRIDPTLRFKTKNKKWNFYIKAKDILQMNKNEIIKTSLYDNYFEEQSVMVMGGYVILGMKYKF